MLDPDFEIQELSGGSANHNFLISMDGQKAVLRRPPQGPLPPGSNDVAREYKVLSRLGDAYPLAPKGLLLCKDLSVVGVPFCVSEFREGVCIGRSLPAPLQSKAGVGATLAKTLIEALVSLHRVDVDRVGLSDLGRSDGFLERQIAGWYKRGLRVLAIPRQKLLAEIRDWLTEKLPESRDTCLVHNDFKLDNMLIDPETLEAQGVVDWDMCTLGDPIYELAILLSYWGAKNDDDLLSYQCRMPCEAPGWWERRQVVDHYLHLADRRVSKTDLTFYWTLSQYRAAVVYAQLRTLHADGERPSAISSEQFDAMEPFVDQLLRFTATTLGSAPAWME